MIKESFDFLCKIALAGLITLEVVRWSEDSLASADLIQIICFVAGQVILYIILIGFAENWCEELDNKLKRKKKKNKKKSELKNYDLTGEE